MTGREILQSSDQIQIDTEDKIIRLLVHTVEIVCCVGIMHVTVDVDRMHAYNLLNTWKEEAPTLQPSLN
jgi:hypothetical protein